MKKALWIILILAIVCVIAIPKMLSLGPNGDYFFPYDDKYFEAAERIVFTTPEEASLNIIPKQGKTLDIRFYLFEKEAVICNSESFTNSRTFYGVSDSFEIPVRPRLRNPEFQYTIDYKESSENSWKSTPTRIVKTPSKASDDKIEIIFISDDHLSDDADPDTRDWRLQDPFLREIRLNGDNVNLFLGELIKSPFYRPKGELKGLMQGFCLASTLYQIMKNENPDLIVNLGDTGIGFGHRWSGLGLKDQHSATLSEIDEYEKIFRIAQRKIFSALTPNIPIYWALGNHDGESGFNRTRESATKYRKKYFKQPVNGSHDENYFWLGWENAETEFIPISSTVLKQRKILLVVLDVMGYNPDLPRKPEEWTLGAEQKEWFKKVLEYDADWKFVCCHHVLGGWPAGSTENKKGYAYGRGPLFTEEDYKDFCNNPNSVEQVGLTRLMLEKGVDAFIYGHDHIFHSKVIGTNSKSRKMRSVCVGSPKYIGELEWYKGAYWRKYYGNYGRYGEYETNWAPDKKVDFWGPSGYTKFTITKDGAEAEYIRSAYHQHTNMSPSIRIGDSVQKIIF